MRFRHCTMAALIVGTLAAAFSEQSAAAAGDIPTPDNPFDYYVGAEESYDSNLYRLPSYLTNISTLIAPNATREDYVTSAFVGFDGLWTPGLQQVSFNVRANDNWFAHNNELNNYSGNADLLWNWRLGSVLSGQVGGDYTRSQANFNETLFLGRDIVNSYDFYGNGRYQIGPRWAVYGGVREADSSHTALAAQYNDYKSSTGNVGVELATSLEDTVGLEYQYLDGRFDHGVFLLNDLPFDRDFYQNTLNLVVKYLLSDKTTINATAGYVKRGYTNEPVGAFSGYNGNVSLQWQLTGKTQITFSGYRQLQAYLGSQSDYFVGTGGSIAPTWVATEKLTFKVIASYANQQYINTSPSVLITGAPRHDKVGAEQATVLYTPIHALTFNFSFTNQNRDSNQPVFGFGDKLASATATFMF
jgi:exopolysaccharide biosynthesis operon protein EpsL